MRILYDTRYGKPYRVTAHERNDILRFLTGSGDSGFVEDREMSVGGLEERHHDDNPVYGTNPVVFVLDQFSEMVRLGIPREILAERVSPDEITQMYRTVCDFPLASRYVDLTVYADMCANIQWDVHHTIVPEVISAASDIRQRSIARPCFAMAGIKEWLTALRIIR